MMSQKEISKFDAIFVTIITITFKKNDLFFIDTFTDTNSTMIFSTQILEVSKE